MGPEFKHFLSLLKKWDWAFFSFVPYLFSASHCYSVLFVIGKIETTKISNVEDCLKHMFRRQIGKTLKSKVDWLENNM